MGQYRTENVNCGRIFRAQNSDFFIRVYRCTTREVGGQRCVFDYVGRGEYYVYIEPLGSSDSPPRNGIRFSISTAIDIYDKQIQAGDVEYNWLDDYDAPIISAGENINGGCFSCGKYRKSRGQLRSDNVVTSREEYVNDEFYHLFDIHSKLSATYRRKWHEDCILVDLNPAINQAVQMCKEEGALKYLRDNNSVHPSQFTE